METKEFLEYMNSDNSVIGAGSVVTKDIPANTVAVGSPARIAKKI